MLNSITTYLFYSIRFEIYPRRLQDIWKSTPAARWHGSSYQVFYIDLIIQYLNMRYILMLFNYFWLAIKWRCRFIQRIFFLNIKRDDGLNRAPLVIIIKILYGFRKNVKGPWINVYWNDNTKQKTSLNMLGNGVDPRMLG